MIKLNGVEIKINHFPDGTQLLKYDWEIVKYCNTITWRYEKEEELSTLIFLTLDIKDKNSKASVDLLLNYVPNARMDRVHKNDVFTLKWFAEVINWLGFDNVYALDVHSNVSLGLIDRIRTCNLYHIIHTILDNIRENVDSIDDLIIYFPDDGAMKRYIELFKQFKMCYGSKKRDWDTGKILNLEVVTNGVDLKGKNVLMVDDIIAYGGTMYYSAIELKRLGVNKIFTYVTHTENSIIDEERGTFIKLLEDGTVDMLYTTNSIFNLQHDKIKIINE